MERDRRKRGNQRRPVDHVGSQPSGVPAAERGSRPTSRGADVVYSHNGYWDPSNPSRGPEGDVLDGVVLANGQVISVMTREGQERAAQLAAILAGSPRVPDRRPEQVLRREPGVGAHRTIAEEEAERGANRGQATPKRTKSK